MSGICDRLLSSRTHLKCPPALWSLRPIHTLSTLAAVMSDTMAALSVALLM